MVALSLVGSAILLFSCDGRAEAPAEDSPEALMTEFSENLSIVNSQNGRRSYHFVTPLLEGYTLAREPYREFRKGVKITTYKDDSLTSVDAELTANYAIYYINRDLWEAKGNVVVDKSDGKTLYTQQLFWNARTKKIYSNVDSKIVQNNGRDVFVGEGFESDEEFKDWRFRRMKGRMEVEMKRAADSAARDSALPAAAPGRGAQAPVGPSSGAVSQAAGTAGTTGSTGSTGTTGTAGTTGTTGTAGTVGTTGTAGTVGTTGTAGMTGTAGTTGSIGTIGTAGTTGTTRSDGSTRRSETLLRSAGEAPQQSAAPFEKVRRRPARTRLSGSD